MHIKKKNWKEKNPYPLHHSSTNWILFSWISVVRFANSLRITNVDFLPVYPWHLFFGQDWRRSFGAWWVLFMYEQTQNWLTKSLISSVLYPVQMFLGFFTCCTLAFKVWGWCLYLETGNRCICKQVLTLHRQ